jgi:hypothetical protein
MIRRLLFEDLDVTFDENFIRREHERSRITENPMAIVHEFEVNHIRSEYPQAYADAMVQPDATQRHQAALEELRLHKENNTWTLRRLPSQAKAIKGKWNFTKKRPGKKHQI